MQSDWYEHLGPHAGPLLVSDIICMLATFILQDLLPQELEGSICLGTCLEVLLQSPSLATADGSWATPTSMDKMTHWAPDSLGPIQMVCGWPAWLTVDQHQHGAQGTHCHLVGSACPCKGNLVQHFGSERFPDNTMSLARLFVDSQQWGPTRMYITLHDAWLWSILMLTYVWPDMVWVKGGATDPFHGQGCG